MLFVNFFFLFSHWITTFGCPPKLMGAGPRVMHMHEWSLKTMPG